VSSILLQRPSDMGSPEIAQLLGSLKTVYYRLVTQ